MTIAIIAHDGKKDELVEFLKGHLSHFQGENIKLVATGTTGGRAQEIGLAVECLASGPLGGDAQIASRITEGTVHMVFFFRDPLDKHPHEPDISMLMRLCDVHNIPLATNPASAELLLLGTATKDERTSQ